MTLILAPDGKTRADRVVQPMTHEQVSWFMDPIAFLKGVPHLWTLNLRLFCLRCWKADLDDDVTVEWLESKGAWKARCACAKIPGRLSVQDVLQHASTTDELLHKLGWSLCCRGRCASDEDMNDGVEANNDPAGRLVSIRCGCTDRRYVMGTV